MASREASDTANVAVDMAVERNFRCGDSNCRWKDDREKADDDRLASKVVSADANLMAR